MGNILEVTGLNKSYKNFSLNDVSFALPQDCITGFIGINGAGKTTTIRSILGLTQRESGKISIFGKDMDKNEKEIKNRIGIVFDEGCFYDELTMGEMKSIIAPAYRRWSNEDYLRYMDKFSLDSTQVISTLSKGMRMKFALTLALSHNADLLIMDEPTSGLDPLIRSEFLEMISEYMKQGGKGVFFSTHNTSDLDKVADVIILIHDGRIIFEQEKDYLFGNYRVVNGDIDTLNSENRQLFLNIQSKKSRFSGMTDDISKVQEAMPDAVIEQPTIEEIMLAHIQGVQKC